MGLRTELGWDCKKAARLYVAVLDNRPHYSIYQIVIDGGEEMCLVPNLVNLRTVQSGSKNLPSIPRGSRKVYHNLCTLGTYHTAREKEVDLIPEVKLWPSTGGRSTAQGKAQTQVERRWHREMLRQTMEHMV